MKYLKTLLALGIFYFCLPFANAQHNQGIGVHFGAYDFYGPQTGNYLFTEVKTVNYNSEIGGNDTVRKNILRWQPMVKFSYWLQWNRYFDFNTALSLANLDYPQAKTDQAFIDRRDYGITTNNQILIELDARANFNILPRDSYYVTPYIFAGLTGSYHPPYFGLSLPVGLGINIRCSKDIYANLEGAYKIKLSNTDQNHLQYSVGLVYWFKPGYKQPKQSVAIPTVVNDADNDGVPDEKDECPSIAGLVEFNGCPDSDNDSIPDQRDDCPMVAGLAAFNGCPDTDNDSIPDQKDKCPYVAGLVQYDGCPPPDMDKDGVTDDMDRCPNEPGPASNGGCPMISQEIITRVQKAAKAIFFETGKATIKKASYKQLDAVVSVLKENPGYYADIEGHTDNVGNNQVNMELSDKRANAVRDYFIAKGIAPDRLAAQGFGSTKPIATNETETGRAANRRTVISLRNYKK